MTLALAALIFGFIAGFSVKSEKKSPCREFTVVEHLSDEDAAFLERGRLSLSQIKAITEEYK